jgi:hypothetical protein
MGFQSMVFAHVGTNTMTNDGHPRGAPRGTERLPLHGAEIRTHIPTAQEANETFIRRYFRRKMCRVHHQARP